MLSSLWLQHQGFWGLYNCNYGCISLIGMQFTEISGIANKPQSQFKTLAKGTSNFDFDYYPLLHKLIFPFLGPTKAARKKHSKPYNCVRIVYLPQDRRPEIVAL